MTKLKIDKYLAFALIFALLNMGAIFAIFGAQKYSDSSGYINVIHWFQGKNVKVTPERALRPLGSLIALPFEFLGEGVGLVVQNVIFYLLATFLIFKITELIYHNKKQAFFASLFFVTATPVIESGLAYLTDTGAWFFYLLSLFLTLIYLKKRKEWLITINGFLSGLGVLMKENGGLGVLFFGLMILLSKEFNAKEKVFKIIHFGIFFIIPIAFLQLFMYQHFQFTSLDWYSGQMSGGYTEEGAWLTALRYVGQLFRILGLLWIFFFIGLWRELREKNWERIKIFLALVPSSFSFLLWPTGGSGRAVFIFAPLGIILATYGCKKIGALPMALLLLTILVLNYYFCWLNPTIPFTEIIYTSIFSR